MEIKDINFSELNPIKKRCIGFGKDKNKVVKHYKMLYSLKDITGNEEHKDLYIEERIHKDLYFLYEDFGTICHEFYYITSEMELERLERCISTFQYWGKDGFLKRLRFAEENGNYISKLEVELCIMLGEVDKANHYRRYREKCMERIIRESQKGA